jgi:hypothetical protein
MNASEFNRLISNNTAAAMQAIAKNEIGFETVIGILESHKQVLFDWKALCAAQSQGAPLIQKSTTLPPNPKTQN